MARSFVESVRFFNTNPNLKTEGLFSSENPKQFSCTKKEGGEEICSHQNIFTNLICNGCGRSPKKINPVWWFFLALCILGFHSTYFINEFLDAEKSKIMFASVFAFFSLLSTVFVLIYVFKIKSGEDEYTTLMLVLCAIGSSALFAIISYFGEEMGFIATNILIGIFSVLFIVGLFNGGKKFCQINNISPWIPFFLVLPVNYVLISSVLLIPFVSENFNDFLRWAEIGSNNNESPPFTILKYVVVAFKYLMEIRLLILLIYVFAVIGIFGILPAMKARKETKLLVFLTQLIAITFVNIKNSLKPLFLTVFWVNIAAFTRNFFTPFLYMLFLGAFFALFVWFPTSTISIFTRIGFSLVIICMLAPLFALFVSLSSRYELKRYYVEVLKDILRASFVVMLATSFFAVVVDISSDFFHWSPTLSVTKITAIVFFIVGAVFLLVFPNYWKKILISTL